MSCVPGRTTLIEGKLQPVAPYSRRWPALFYTENRRVLTELHSEQFGTILMVEIGAFTVGSIRQCYEPRDAVAKGARKGHFELGGSTVVLLFEPGRVRYAQDLVRNQSKEGVRSRYSVGFGQPVVETDVMVRSLLAYPMEVQP